MIYRSTVSDIEQWYRRRLWNHFVLGFGQRTKSKVTYTCFPKKERFVVVLFLYISLFIAFLLVMGPIKRKTIWYQVIISFLPILIIFIIPWNKITELSVHFFNLICYFTLTWEHFITFVWFYPCYILLPSPIFLRG